MKKRFKFQEYLEYSTLGELSVLQKSIQSYPPDTKIDEMIEQEIKQKSRPLKILFSTSGGQTKGNSPSQRLAKRIMELYDNVSIDMYSIAFNPMPDNLDFSQYDLIWGEMDSGNHLVEAQHHGEKHGIPTYLHGEWIPPFAIEEGWTEHFGAPTELLKRERYMNNLEAMKRANLVSLALSDTAGGFQWIEDKWGVTFKNAFVRYPACPKYAQLKEARGNSVATIARANAGQKKVAHTLEAIKRSKMKPKFLLIGGDKGMSYEGVDMESLGKFNTDDKVKVFAQSKVAVQHWSGIPPAEAIQQGCVVLSYDMPYMRELYGDALIWVKKDDINALSEAIDYWLTHDEEREIQATKALNLLYGGKCGVKLEDHRANLVMKKIFETLGSL